MKIFWTFCNPDVFEASNDVNIERGHVSKKGRKSQSLLRFS